MLYCAERDSEVGGLPYEAYRLVVNVDEPYARRTQELGGHLVSDDVDK